MATINKQAPAPRTHGGGLASRDTLFSKLQRMVLACMLWEDQFYMDGQSTAKIIADIVPQVSADKVAKLAIDARDKFKLRHVPLLLVRELARGSKEARLVVADTLASIIQRPDELTEFLAIYWKEKKQPLSAQVKKGLAKAFGKFNEYSLAKYNRDGAVKLRDVLFLSHAKPANEQQEALYKKLVDKALATPDTWEVELSASQDKKASWTRLLADKRLGALALLRNLRNMTEANIPDDAIKEALSNIDVERVLPFRFLTAARHNPKFEPQLEQAMFKCVADAPKLSGKTVLMVDVSGSMAAGGVSGKSELSRLDTASALAILIRELSDNCVVYCTAGNDSRRVHKTELIPARRGFALKDAIHKAYNSLGGGGIFLKQCTEYAAQNEGHADRYICITDEQDTSGDKLSASKTKVFADRNYIINIASYANGIASEGNFEKVNGFSEAVVDYILALESSQQQ